LGFFGVVEGYLNDRGERFNLLGSFLRLALSFGLAVIVLVSIAAAVVTRKVSKGAYFHGSGVTSLLWAYVLLVVCEVLALVLFIVLYAAGYILNWNIVCRNEMKFTSDTTVSSCASTANSVCYVLLFLALTVAVGFATQASYLLSSYGSDPRRFGMVNAEERAPLV
jgi:predicted membrane protein